MGAIYGFAGFQEDDLLGRMARVARPRGPVDDGFFLAPEGELAALGRSSPAGRPGGDGPAFSADRRVVAVMVGQVTNWRRLAEELAVPASGQAALLVAGYEVWGLEALLPRLEGAFVLSLWDGRTGTLHVVRDRVGRLPVYYTQPGGRLLFASSIKPLLESVHVEARLHLRSLDACLAWGLPPSPTTLFAGVHSLPAGHRMERSPLGEVSILPWWQPKLPAGDTAKGDETAAFEAFTTHWNAAWRTELEAMAPGGVVWRGRMEETLLAAVVARSHPSTRLISFRGPDAGGRTPEAAARIATALGLVHHEVELDGSLWERLPEWVWQAERPLGDPAWLAQAALASQVASEVPVMWDGRIASGLSGGEGVRRVLEVAESRYRLLPRVARQGLLLPGLVLSPWQWRHLLAPLAPALGHAAAWSRVRDLLAGYGRRSLPCQDAVLRAMWSQSERRALYTNEFKSLAAEEAQMTETTEEQAAPFANRLCGLELRGHVPTVLEMESALALPHGVAWQHPWLDHHLAEFALGLAPELVRSRPGPGPLVQRLAEQLVPKPVRSALKSAVPSPALPLLFQPEFFALAAEFLAPDRVRRRGWFVPAQVAAWRLAMEHERDVASARRVLVLVTLELWLQIFVDKTLSFSENGG